MTTSILIFTSLLKSLNVRSIIISISVSEHLIRDMGIIFKSANMTNYFFVCFFMRGKAIFNIIFIAVITMNMYCFVTKIGCRFSLPISATLLTSAVSNTNEIPGKNKSGDAYYKHRYTHPL